VSEPVALQWSGGKDSALAPEALTSDPGADVVGLLVPYSDAYDRVTKHVVRRELIDAQAQAPGQTLVPMALPIEASNAAYEARLRDALSDLMDRGISTVATGDVSLDDGRQYREDRLGDIGECHSLICDGPRFARPIDVRLGEIVTSNGHCYPDLIPGA